MLNPKRLKLSHTFLMIEITHLFTGYIKSYYNVIFFLN